MSKLLWIVAAPDNFFLLLLCLGLVLWWRGRARLGRALAGVAAGFFALMLLFPVDAWLLKPLEDRFPAQTVDLAPVDGVVVLGGGLAPGLSAERGQYNFGDAADRLVYFLILAKKHPRAKLVFTGGTGDLLDQANKEATYIPPLMADLGFDPTRVIFEGNSRNTAENAAFAKDLARPEPGERWLLVTSAFHMPRSVGCFRKAGFPVTAFPVDYRTDLSPRFNPLASFVERLRGVNTAWREYLGLAAYRATGKTDELFPGP